MNINYLREFVTLSKFLNYSRAAKELFISQSSLSYHIISVENELGFSLFEREPTGISLTAAGKLFLLSCQRILADYDASVQQCSDIAARRIPLVRISNFAFHYKFWNDMMERAVRDTRFRVQIVPYRQSSTCQEALLDRSVDMFPYFSIDEAPEVVDRLEAEGLHATYLGTDPIILWMDEANPLAKRPAVLPSDLVGKTVLLSNALYASQWCDAVARQLKTLGSQAPEVAYVDYDETNEYAFLDVANSVAVGTVMAFENMVARYNSRAVRRTVEGLDLHIDVYVARRADDSAAAALLQSIGVR